ncbi:hypothetical protein SFRURICE_010419 [Spodoptera frugiperda]|uniref:SFRICE_037840 n=1 Tax=Spodoptera frugiperda TaxID=7108 RepID=A0A2H1VP53_SPOFR|nr:hypothetical protein SFRURICE_010419 [Spodoptera frugiperda]
MEPAFKGLTGVNYNLTILIDDWITDTGFKIAFEKDINVAPNKGFSPVSWEKFSRRSKNSIERANHNSIPRTLKVTPTSQRNLRGQKFWKPLKGMQPNSGEGYILQIRRGLRIVQNLQNQTS